MNKSSYMAKPGEVTSKCYVIDAQDKILGRLAAKAAVLLRGKHKPQYTPNVVTGDMVVVINAEKIRVTGKKMTDKIYQKYSGYPSGQKHLALQDLLHKRPEQVVRLAVNRMIPKGPLGNSIRTRLHVYAGDKHPHQAQQPIVFEV